MQLSIRTLRRTLPALLLPLGACDHGHGDGHGHDAHASDAAHAVEATAAADTANLPGQALACGCSLPAVGHCSEWAEVDGQMVELVLPATSGLGSMPFCGKSGLRAELEGELFEGRYVVTNFRYIQ